MNKIVITIQDVKIKGVEQLSVEVSAEEAWTPNNPTSQCENLCANFLAIMQHGGAAVAVEEVDGKKVRGTVC